MTSTDLPAKRSRRRCSEGSSSLHGTHHVAQKLTITTRPRNASRSAAPPWRSDSASLGVAGAVHALICVSATATDENTKAAVATLAAKRTTRQPISFDE